MKKLLLLLCIFFLALPLWGEYFYQNDPDVFTLIHLSRRMGKVFPFTSFPVHGSDLFSFANTLALDPLLAFLNDAEKEMLEVFISKMEKQRELNLMVYGRLFASYEHRLSTGTFLFGEEKLPFSEDVRRSYLGFSPVFSFLGGVGTFNGLYLALQGDLRPSWDDDFSPMSNFFTNVDIMYDFLTKGILTYNGEYINLFFGRDSYHLGNPQGSTLYVSSFIPHLDGIRLNIPLGPFSFDYSLSSIMPKRARHLDVDETVNSEDPNNPLGPHFGFMKDVNDENPSTILFMTTRFQWNFGSIKTGLGTTMVYARANNQFLFTDFLPIMILHNADSVPNNMSLIIDAQWTVIPGLTLSGMVGFDDISAKDIGIPDGKIPTIPGFILQLEYSRASENVFQYYILEGGYTHYLWGNFAYNDKPDSWLGVYLARAIYRFTPNKYAVLLPLTSPYGPGALWAKFLGRFLIPEINMQAAIEILLLFKNSRVNLVYTEYEENNSLNSFDQWFLTIDFPVTYNIRSFQFLVSPAILFNNFNAVFECTLGVRWQIKGLSGL